jgi:hypothetical protein
MKTILDDKELLKAIKNGVWAKLKGFDEEYTHYKVIDFNSNELLICFGGIKWDDGETNYYPHTVSQHAKNKIWFFENPIKKDGE